MHISFLSVRHLMIAFLCIIIATQTLFFFTKQTTTPTQQKKENIPPTEDLMREHGILNRILLLYEAFIKHIDNNTELPVPLLNNTIDIVQAFIENYHEKLEENYIFPLFERQKQELQLITTLKNQHNKGREITNKLKTLITLQTKNYTTIKNLLQKFITMYRPHEAREDTELFPKVRSLLSTKEFEELSEQFENLEHTLFGENGFEMIVKKVTAIEKELGINTLDKFTP